MKINGFDVEKYNQYDIKKDAKTSICPLCSANRKKKTEKCLMIDWDRALATCQHCGEILQIHTYKKRETEKQYSKPTWKNNTHLSDKTVEYFEGRKISQQVLKNMKLTEGREWMPQFKKEVNTMQFNYFINHELINVKYRGPKKSFKLHKDSELIFYNLDAIKNETEVYIYEGEIDCLSSIQVGENRAISVPNGATEKRINLEYLDNCFQFFENKEKIIMCLDNDIPGKNLQKELVRRFGVEKCYYVDFEDCNDANEYHVKYGGERLKKALENIIRFPITDIATMQDDGHLLDDYLINGLPKGFEIGLNPWDDIFTVETGKFMVITGIPTHGKTTALDHFIVRWNLMYDWKIAIASPEYDPKIIHKERLITKLIGFEPKGKKNVNSDAYKQAKQYIDDNYFMIDFKDGRYELERTLKKAKELIVRKGIKVIVLDPFNKIRLKKSIGKGWNDYASDYLNELEVFAKANDVLIVLVAHPVKMQKDVLGNHLMPTFYDVKGGGEFYDMSPFGIVVHRDKEKKVIIMKVLKCKYQHLGTNGEEVEFKYNINNGRLSEIKYEEAIYDNSNWLNSDPKEQKVQFENTEENFYESVDDFEEVENIPF